MKYPGSDSYTESCRRHAGARRTGLLSILLTFWIVSADAQTGQGISNEAVAELAARAMTEFQVPGMAIGIVKSGEVLLSQGYGVREIGKPEPVDTKTLFKIASNSKAFTTAALAVLVDDGAIAWDGLVIDYLPQFRMHDPWVTAGFTVTDLLTHRSGLKPFMGDMMLWPEPNAFTAEDIMHALRYFKPVSGFRSRYAYDNLLYIVAGQIFPPVGGQTWGEFVEQRLMRPAGMKRCFADRIPNKEMRNMAAPHGVIEGKLQVIERSRIPTQPPVSAPAGGVVCSAGDMLTWVRTQLGHGTAPNGKQLFSAAQSAEMWKPQMILNVSEHDYEMNRTHFKAYGLGWRLADVNGYKEVSHTGTLAGMKSYVVMLPELELGVVLLTNGSSSDARTSVMNTIVRSFMPVEQLDWIQVMLDEQEAEKAEQHPTIAEAAPRVDSCAPCASPDLAALAGRYRDPWFGDVIIRLVDGELVFDAEKSPKLSGPLSDRHGNRFVIRWTDRTLEADAYIQFETDKDNRVTSITMFKLDDGDFDFEDLNLTRVD